MNLGISALETGKRSANLAAYKKAAASDWSVTIVAPKAFLLAQQAISCSVLGKHRRKGSKIKDRIFCANLRLAMSINFISIISMPFRSWPRRPEADLNYA
jgi:hypothetical protein